MDEIWPPAAQNCSPNHHGTNLFLNSDANGVRFSGSRKGSTSFAIRSKRRVLLDPQRSARPTARVNVATILSKNVFFLGTMALFEGAKEVLASTDTDHAGCIWRYHRIGKRNSRGSLYLHDFLGPIT